MHTLDTFALAQKEILNPRRQTLKIQIVPEEMWEPSRGKEWNRW